MDQAPKAFLPLDHIKVLDLTHARAGPTAVRQLADWGADVTWIEPPIRPGEDRKDRHGHDQQNLHRNKRGMTLNLKSEEGREIFFRLAERADVIVENFRPDVKHRLGIDYQSVRAVNPSIVYGSISGFGQTGPYADRPGVDPIAQAMSGLMSVTGIPEQGPMRVGTPTADLTTGFFLAAGISLALLHRERTGEGQWVHTSLIETQVQLLDHQATRWLVDGVRPPPAGNQHPTSAPNGMFEASDGYIVLSAAGNRFQRLCRAFGTMDLLERPEYATAALRFTNRLPLNATITEITRQKTRADLIEILNDAGVPCGPIYYVDEMFQDPQVQHLNITRPVDHPKLGTIELIGQAVHLEGTPQPDRITRPTPDVGQHTDQVLSELGSTPDEILELRKRGVI